MKKLLLTALTALSSALLAQGPYTIKMSMKMEGLPAEYAAYGEYEITTYLNGQKSKTEVTNMMMSNQVFVDGKNVVSLTDAMGNKSGYTATREEMEANDKKETKTKPKIEYTQEKKMIAGYECTKAVVTNTDKDKKEAKTIVWVTDKITVSDEARKSMRKNITDLGDLKGYPLGLEAQQNANGMDVKMVMTATEVLTTPIDDATFKPDTTGYKMMTYKEFIAKSQQK